MGDVELAGFDFAYGDKINARNDELGTVSRASKKLAEYFIETTAVARQIAGGDLTVEVTPKAETDLLGHAVKQMVVSLRTLVGQVADTANSVGAASSQLSAASNQAGQAAAQVATTIQQVAAGTAQQTEGVTRAANTIEEVSRAIDGVTKGAQEQAAAVGQSVDVTTQMSGAIQQVTASAQAGVRSSAEAAEAARTGATTIEATIEGMHNIKAKVDLSAQRVQEMGQRSGQIGAIVETIDDIASQTNLLALNAAIEAARAGEHGKGFAVVADEVRKLAEKSADATREIGGLIKGIQQTVAEAVAAMDEGSAEVETGVAHTNEAGQALGNILQAVEAVNQQVSEIAAAAEQMGASANEMVSAMDTVSAVVEENTAATEEMAASSGEVSRAIESVASVSEENSAAAQEVSAATEEMNAQIEEVTASAQSLHDTAQGLQELVAQFKLDATGAEGLPKPAPGKNGHSYESLPVAAGDGRY